MEKNGSKFILPIIAFLFGLIIIDNIMAGLALAGLVSFIRYVVLYQQYEKEPSKTIFGESEDFINVVLLLSAAVIKADGRIYKKELDLVRKRLTHDFGTESVEKYMLDLSICLKKKIKVESVCNAVRYNLDYPGKIQLLHFLTGLTVTNGIIVDSEFDLLQKISSLIELPERSFISILAMFNFRREHSYNRSHRNGQKAKPTSFNELSRAFRILEIDKSASDEEVKKAYRKLAKIHHPDRVFHLGPEFQKNSKVKFQKIADAYELIKDKKGFN